MLIVVKTFKYVHTCIILVFLVFKQIKQCPFPSVVYMIQENGPQDILYIYNPMTRRETYREGERERDREEKRNRERERVG